MVTYPSEAQRDADHDRFIEALNRNQAARLFESHLLDIADAAGRCVARTLNQEAFLLLLRHEIETLGYYVAGGPGEKALARRRPGAAALDLALDAFLEAQNDEDPDGAQSGATLEAARRESGDCETIKLDSYRPESASGTEIANTNS